MIHAWSELGQPDRRRSAICYQLSFACTQEEEHSIQEQHGRLPGAALPPGSLDSRIPTVIAVLSITLAVATTSVVLQVYTRVAIVKQFGIDDLFAFLLS